MIFKPHSLSVLKFFARSHRETTDLHPVVNSIVRQRIPA